jgi:hypothetical protein
MKNILLLSLLLSTSIATAKVDIMTCDFGELAQLKNVITEEQKDYELNLALFRHLTYTSHAGNQLLDKWKVHEKLENTSRSIKEQNDAFQKDIRDNILNELYCTCLSAREKELAPTNQEGMRICKQQETKEVSNITFKTANTDVIRQNIACDATKWGENLVSSGDPETYMHTCSYCPADSLFKYNTICETITISEDNSRQKSAQLIKDLLAGGSQDLVNRTLLVEVEKAYAKIQKRYLQRVQNIQSQIENAYEFAKTAYAKDPCDNCFQYAGTYDSKTIIVDPWNNGKPLSFMIPSYNNNYAPGKLGYMDLYTDHLNLVEFSEDIHQLVGDLSKADREILANYFRQEHYLKPKQFVTNKKITPGIEVFTTINNFNLKEYGGAYPFDGMLSYIKSLYGSTQKLSTLAVEQTNANESLVHKQGSALVKEISLQAKHAVTPKSQKILLDLQTHVEKLSSDDSKVKSALKNLGLNDKKEISAENSLAASSLDAFLQNTPPQLSLSSFHLNPKAAGVINSAAVISAGSLTGTELSDVQLYYAYAISQPAIKEKITKDNTSARVKNYQTMSKDLASVTSAELEEKSFKSFYKKANPHNTINNKTVVSVSPPSDAAMNKDAYTTTNTAIKSISVNQELAAMPERHIASVHTASSKNSEEQQKIKESAQFLKNSASETKKLESKEEDGLFEKINKAYKRNYIKIAE